MTTTARPFNLTRWFAMAALASIAVLAVSIGLLLDRFLTERMVSQEAVLTREFVDSLLRVEESIVRYVRDPAERTGREVPEAFEHLARVPDVLRANLYDRQQQLVWSTDASLRGRTFNRNPELDRALAGAVVAKQEHEDDDEKSEHQSLGGGGEMFVEIYVPVRSAEGQVLGAIEFYKQPRALARSLTELRWYIAVGSLAAGALLFAALYGLVRRADRTMRAQQRQLVDQATLAALGEMSGAVAHGIRNPLASIRSSAELMIEGAPEEAKSAAQDIVSQADRLEVWVRELLAYTQPPDAAQAAEPVVLPPLVGRCMDDFAREFERRHIDAHRDLPADLPSVRGDALMLAQVLRTLVSNAVEALGARGGRIEVSGRKQGGQQGVLLEVRDTGPGLTRDQLAKVGQPFYTTKPRGLGVGLAMARRVIERAGGRLEIDSQPGVGTTVRLHLAAA